MPDTATDRSRAFIFAVGAGLMFFWPLLGISIQYLDGPVTRMLIYFVGAFVLLFDDGMEALTGTLMDRFGATAVEIILWTIVGIMILTWIAILCLPLFGQWKRHRLILWFMQSSYAAAHALCGYFYAARFQ